MDKLIYIVMNITVNVKKGQIARVPMGAPARLLKGVLTFPSSSGWPRPGTTPGSPGTSWNPVTNSRTRPRTLHSRSLRRLQPPLLHTEASRLPSQITQL